MIEFITSFVLVSCWNLAYVCVVLLDEQKLTAILSKTEFANCLKQQYLFLVWLCWNKLISHPRAHNRNTNSRALPSISSVVCSSFVRSFTTYRNSNAGEGHGVATKFNSILWIAYFETMQNICVFVLFSANILREFSFVFFFLSLTLVMSIHTFSSQQRIVLNSIHRSHNQFVL